MKNFNETRNIEEVRVVKNIHNKWKIIASVTGCRVIRLSKPPSKSILKKKTSITPNSSGSVGRVSAANSLNSIVNESGVKKRIKYTSLSIAINADKMISSTNGMAGRK